MTRVATVVLALFALVATAVVTTTSIASAAPPELPLHPAAAGIGYTSLTPARLLDTRPGTATIDGQFVGTGPVEHFLDLPVRGRGGVPSSGVSAVALNVTVTAPTSSSFLTVWPAGEAQPNASNINFSPDQTIANAVVVKLGADGKISFFNETGTTHLVVDVVGWFASASDYTARVPARVLDTRPDGTTLDGQFKGGGMPTSGTVSLQVTGRADVPSTATAVAMNVTVVAPTADSFATVWPSDAPQPNASNLNFQAGRNVANLVVSQIGADGRVLLNIAAGNAYLIADVVGWFEGAGQYEPLVPARLLDTRSPNATIDGQFSGGGPVAGGTWIDVPVVGRGGVPSIAVDAVVVNVTATQPNMGSFVTVWPTDGHGPPNSSTLNLVPDRTVPNLAIVKVGAGGKISLFNEQGLTHLIVDVVGYFPHVLSFDTHFLTPAVVSSPYSATLAVSGGAPPYEFAAFGTAPGLSVNGAGQFSGTPTTAGTFTSFVLAGSSDGGLGAALLPHFVFGSADGFQAVTPTTLYDSYPAPASEPGDSVRDILVADGSLIPADAEAVVLNVTTSGDGPGFLMVYPSGASQPNAASLDVHAGSETSNTLVVPVGVGGRVSIYNALNTVDYRIEIAGYFGAGSSYNAVSPVRAADSRAGGSIPLGKVAPNTTRTIQITGLPGVPATPGLVKSVILNVISTEATGSGSFDVVASGGAAPSAPSMYWGSGTYFQTVVVPVNATTGAIDVTNAFDSESATHLIVDVFGYFT